MRPSVLLIRRQYTPYGGAERTLAQFAKRLKSKGGRILVAASHWKGESDGIECFRVWSPRKPSWLGALVFAYRCAGKGVTMGFDLVLSLERTLKQDIYRAGDGCHSSWLSKRAATDGWIKGKLLPILRPLNWVNLYLEKKVFDPGRTGLVIANSQMVADEVIDLYGFPKDRVVVVRNGVDRTRFLSMPRAIASTKIREQYSIPTGQKIMLFLGSGFHRKGLNWAIEALARMDKDASLLVAGKGRTGSYIALARRLGVDRRIHFAGPVDDAVPLLRGSDILILPTIYDPCSNACMEALACGTPVVTTRWNGASEFIIDDIQGRVVDRPWNITALAKGCSDLLDIPGGHPEGQASGVPDWDSSMNDLWNVISGFLAGRERVASR